MEYPPPQLLDHLLVLAVRFEKLPEANPDNRIYVISVHVCIYLVKTVTWNSSVPFWSVPTLWL